jgi:pimeloyl-ACP methyl ester carboxylesterase
MVVSYDRRANGRSPVPGGWDTTSPEEQADDAAALLDALATGPAAVFGTSSGGNFALCLMVRHPEFVLGAILQSRVVRPRRRLRRRSSACEGARPGEAMEAGGPPAAVERFWCYMAGDDGWNRLAPALRERLRASAGTLFGVELGTYELYLPGEEALAALSAPVRPLVSEQGASPSSLRSPVGSASGWAWMSPPLRARTRRITSTLRSSRRSSGHSSLRSAG